MTRDGWKCRHCRFRNNLHGHHVKFKSHFGGDYSWNLLTLCNECHEALHRCWLLIFVDGTQITGNTDTNIEQGHVTFKRVNGWRPKG